MSTGEMPILCLALWFWGRPFLAFKAWRLFLAVSLICFCVPTKVPMEPFC